MAYIGNQVSSVLFTVNTFSGDASATSFGPMDRAPAGPASVAVFVAGSYKTPSVDYTVSGTSINFTSPPASGTNNIVVHHLGNGVMATQTPVDGSVTGAKLTDNSVRGNNIVAGQITGNLIAVGAVTTNHISVGAITGNLLATNIINSNNIVDLAILGNDLGIQSVSGNNIGLGAISSNHFAGGGVTSDVLSSNLTVSTARVAETINVVTSAIGGNYEIHIANSTVYHFLANTSANVTFQMIANTGRSVDTMLSIGQSASVAIMMKQGTTRYRANIHIDGVLQTAYWAGNAQPQYVLSGGAQPMSYEAYNFSIIKIAPSQYTVFASNTNYGQANGQGMGVTVSPFGPVQ